MFNQKDNDSCRSIFYNMSMLAKNEAAYAVMRRSDTRMIFALQDALERAYREALNRDYVSANQNPETHFWVWAWNNIALTVEYRRNMEVRNWLAAQMPLSEMSSDGVTGD